MRVRLSHLFLLPLFAVPAAALAQQIEFCPDRPQPGSVVGDAIQLHSVNGTLKLDLTMVNNVDSVGITHYCFRYADGTEAPTLVAKQGDRIVLNVTNHLVDLPGAQAKAPMHMSHDAMPMSAAGPSDPCGGGEMAVTSTNVHFHGLNIPPRCHQDETIRTTILPEQSFQYEFKIPANEPPGLYWYHPHMHGFTTTHVTGGAAGALIVEGIEQVKPEVAGLPEKVIVLRQFAQLPPPPPAPPAAGAAAPPVIIDPDDLAVLSVNWVPAPGNLLPPVIQIQPGEKQFWRVLNATSIHFFALQLQADLVPQNMQLVGMDGVPLTNTRNVDTIILPPAGRAEFIVEGPPATTNAKFVSLAFDTGPDGDYNPYAVIASVVPPPPVAAGAPSGVKPLPVMPAFKKKQDVRRFAGLAATHPVIDRKLFFSEVVENGVPQFFITVDGQKPKVFEHDDPPAIVTREGAVEDWTIENRSSEVHAFHIHQIHFLELEENGVPIADPRVLDTIVVPYWDGVSPTYPSVKLRMDFRDPETAGTFLYHCHILDHGDNGMMAKIEVKPKKKQ